MTILEYLHNNGFQDLDSVTVYDEKNESFASTIYYYESPEDGFEKFVTKVCSIVNVTNENDNLTLTCNFTGFVNEYRDVMESWLGYTVDSKSTSYNENYTEDALEQLEYALRGDISYQQGEEFVKLIDSRK